jgi:hypothetical protein
VSPLVSRADLVLAPEALTLEILDAALAAAENALWVVHPDLDTLGDAYGRTPPPPSVLLAALLLPRLAELRDLLGWYRTTYRGEDMPAGDEPF